MQNLPITRTAIDWLNGSVGAEDNHQVMSVHVGNKSRGFEGARFLVDDERSRLSEHPGAAFHRRIYEVVAGGVALAEFSPGLVILDGAVEVVTIIEPPFELLLGDPLRADLEEPFQ